MRPPVRGDQLYMLWPVIKYCNNMKKGAEMRPPVKNDQLVDSDYTWNATIYHMWRVVNYNNSTESSRLPDQ